MTLGEKIKEARTQSCLSQEQLAQKLCVSRSAVAKWETDKGLPDIENVKALSQLLGVTTDHLLDNGRKIEMAGLRESIEEEGGQLAGSIADKKPEAGNGSDTKCGAGKERKYSPGKSVWAWGLTVLLLIGAAACAIVDMAVTGRLTWSLYPISSIVFAWCILFPTLLGGKRGIVFSMAVLTVLIVPYLLVLDKLAIAEGAILKVGSAVAMIALVFLWAAAFVLKRFKSRKRLSVGISAILAAPACILINGMLSVVLAPEAGVFDIWDVSAIAVFVIAGVALIGSDILSKKKFGTSSHK